jgi:hypothetical protein
VREGVQRGGVFMNIGPIVPPAVPRWLPAWLDYLEDLEYLANMGGPSSRTCSQRLFSTVFEDDDGPIRCPRVLQVGIDFARRQPIPCARGWLRAAGFADEQEARAVLRLPPEPCICRIDPVPSPAAAAALTPLEGLRLALVLGLCTPHLYDPQRPVLWTEASLTRRLLLYDGGGFYA